MKVLIDGIYYGWTTEPVVAVNIYGHVQTINPSDYSLYNFVSFKSVTVNGTTLTKDEVSSLKRCTLEGQCCYKTGDFCFSTGYRDRTCSNIQ